MNTAYHGPEIPNDILKVRRRNAKLAGKVFNGLSEKEAFGLVIGRNAEWMVSRCEHCRELTYGPVATNEDVQLARFSYPETALDEETKQLIREADLEKVPSEE